MIALISVLAAASATFGCSDDSTPTGGNDCMSCACSLAACASLSTRIGLLRRIEDAYNNRRIDAYTDLLDENFTFFLSSGDVNHGYPEQWDRATEVELNTQLFDNSQKIMLDLRTEDGLGWSEYPSPTSPGETWYSATVIYFFAIKIGSTTYITPQGSQATFIVRNVGTDEQQHWQLAQMRDIGAFTGALASSAHCVQCVATTFGNVKALYLDASQIKRGQ